MPARQRDAAALALTARKEAVYCTDMARLALGAADAHFGPWQALLAAAVAAPLTRVGASPGAVWDLEGNGRGAATPEGAEHMAASYAARQKFTTSARDEQVLCARPFSRSPCSAFAERLHRTQQSGAHKPPTRRRRA